MALERSYKRFSVEEEEYSRILSHCKGVLSDCGGVVFAYLYGSFTGKQNFADIDLAVYLQGVKREDYLKQEIDLESRLKKKIPYPLDVRVLNDAPVSFRYSVIKNGIRLVDKEEDMRVDFETRTLSRYFDFLPFRERYFKEALDREV